MSPAPSSGISRGQVAALYFSFALIGAVLWPIHQNWRDDPKDNFPLSYYPMFSAKRDSVENFVYAVGVDAEGKRYAIPESWIGEGGENQTRRQLRKIINAGLAPELAAKIARRVAQSKGKRWRKVVSVSVCKGRYSLDDYFHGKKDPLSEISAGTAEVDRTAS